MTEHKTTLTDFQDSISTTINAYVNKVAKETNDLVIGVMTEYLTEQGMHKVFEINGANLLACVSKQMPKQVKLYIGQDMQCPECNKRLRNYEGMKICYCKFCGQALER